MQSWGRVISRAQIINGKGPWEDLLWRPRTPIIHSVLLNSESLLPCPVWYKNIIFSLKEHWRRKGLSSLSWQALLPLVSVVEVGVQTLDRAHPSECWWHSAGVFIESFLCNNAPTGTFFDPSVGALGSFLESFTAPSPLLASSQWLSGEPSWCRAKFPASSSTHPADSLTASWWISCPPTSACYMLLGKKKKITPWHSWPTVLLCLPSSNHQSSRGRYLSCQPWFVVFNAPASVHWLQISSDQGHLNKCIFCKSIHSSKIWILGLERIIPFNAYVFLGYSLSAVDDSLEFSFIPF